MKRVGRYLLGVPTVSLLYEHEEGYAPSVLSLQLSVPEKQRGVMRQHLGNVWVSDTVMGFADSGWGGDDGRSTSGSFLFWGTCLLSSFSRTHATTALSSA